MDDNNRGTLRHYGNLAEGRYEAVISFAEYEYECTNLQKITVERFPSDGVFCVFVFWGNR